jgi:hypothetical protein
MLEWLRRNIEYLTDTRKITLANLMIAKYALMNKLLAKTTLLFEFKNGELRSDTRTGRFQNGKDSKSRAAKGVKSSTKTIRRT